MFILMLNLYSKLLFETFLYLIYKSKIHTHLLLTLYLKLSQIQIN